MALTSLLIENETMMPPSIWNKVGISMSPNLAATRYSTRKPLTTKSSGNSSIALRTTRYDYYFIFEIHICISSLNWNLVVQQPAVVVPFAKHASGFGLCDKVQQGLFIHALVSGLIECHIVGTNTLVERWKGLECSPYTS